MLNGSLKKPDETSGDGAPPATPASASSHIASSSFLGLGDL